MTQPEYRTDLRLRWKSIKNSMGELSGKSLLDIGCSNGWFCERFLLEGGKSAVGVEPDDKWTDQLKQLSHPGFKLLTGVSQLKDTSYDFALYLDLHFHEGANFIPLVKKIAKVCFISPSGQHRSQELLKELRANFKSVVMVHEGDWGRNTYRCE